MINIGNMSLEAIFIRHILKNERKI